MNQSAPAAAVRLDDTQLIDQSLSSNKQCKTQILGDKNKLRSSDKTPSRVAKTAKDKKPQFTRTKFVWDFELSDTLIDTFIMIAPGDDGFMVELAKEFDGSNHDYILNKFEQSYKSPDGIKPEKKCQYPDFVRKLAIEDDVIESFKLYAYNNQYRLETDYNNPKMRAQPAGIANENKQFVYG